MNLLTLGQLYSAAPLPFWAMLAVAYLIGSVPTAVWVSKLVSGKDIREMGSGNAGSTNTYRNLGFWPGMTVQVVDILKGVAAALLPVAFLSDDSLAGATALDYATVQCLCGLLAVVGHIWPVLAGFRGGKGMNTLLGMMLTIFPWAALIALGVFIVLLLLSKMVSLSSMGAAWVMPAYVGYLYTQQPIIDYLLLAVAILVPLLVMFTHRSNIQRIRAGNESKVGFLTKKEKQA